MTPALRRLFGIGVPLVFVAAACSTAATSAGPSQLPSVAPATSMSPVPTATPSSTPVATPTSVPSAAACVGLPQSVGLPSDRVTDLTYSSGADADRLTFVFGNPSLPGPAEPPQGSLEVARPPFTQAGSGAAIDMLGEHVLQVRFTGMSITNDVGQPTYTGPQGFETPDLPALRHAVLFDAYEGIMGWYVGYDGAGCVTLSGDGTAITVDIGHP
jgi:hypothetical protein